MEEVVSSNACQVTISSPLISPSGRELDRWTTNFAGQVILGNEQRSLNPLPGFPVSPALKADIDKREAAAKAAPAAQ